MVGVGESDSFILLQLADVWHETLLQVLPEKGHQSPLIPTLIRLDVSGGAVS